MKKHSFRVQITWTGNNGTGTSGYRAYSRNHIISDINKPDIQGSSDVVFRGEAERYNPEQLFVASISGCHMLWFLHLCADNGVVVSSYSDNPVGIMTETEDGGGKFTEVTLNPHVVVAEKSMLAHVDRLHDEAHDLCFNSGYHNS
jgi:organic hydroperoxide reductase OsmC/OhrA